MSERTSYEPGTPSWVDLTTTDVDAAKAFYAGLFGWEASEAGPPEETGGYAMFTFNGKLIAGIGPVQGEGQPTVWSTYVSTDDADSAADRARAAGADVLVGPMDVMDAGRMAVFAHPAAGYIGVWQPGEHKGAQLVNEPVSLSWNELHTRDLEGAKAFGESVFGWRPEEQDLGGMPYVIGYLGDQGVCGMAGMPPGVPDEVPAHWLTFFSVDDADATLAKAQELGGSVTMPPMDVEGVGRFAVLGDPQGAQFGVIKNATPG